MYLSYCICAYIFYYFHIKNNIKISKIYLFYLISLNYLFIYYIIINNISALLYIIKNIKLLTIWLYITIGCSIKINLFKNFFIGKVLNKSWIIWKSMYMNNCYISLTSLLHILYIFFLYFKVIYSKVLLF